jgi:glutamyl/glutaminyl-tRNA synthetase
MTITRFAPSPTGELHLGHVLHAIWLWETARITESRVLIRIEDHDRSRCTPGYERAILTDLHWLGFRPDHASLVSLEAHPSPYRQSDHPLRYEHAFARLQQVTRVYGCTCTRAMLEPVGDGGERRYTGACRDQPIDRGERCVVRAELPDEEVQLEDLRHGKVVQHPQRDSGDIAIRDAKGQWTYQFCVAVDDMLDGVDVVVRGDDLLSSTGRQWLLARMLGREQPPVTLHHPLLFGEHGGKLSKRDLSETVRSMRERGMTALEVLTLARDKMAV